MTDPGLLPLLSIMSSPPTPHGIGGTGDDLRYAPIGSSGRDSGDGHHNNHHQHHIRPQREPDGDDHDMAHDDEDGEPPILLSLIEDGLWTEAARRARDHPTEASRISPDGRGTPLHLACMNDGPPSLINALLHAHPPASAVADDDGWTPLHTACYFDAGHEVVRRLLLADPTVVNVTDAEGRTPLALLHFVTASRWRGAGVAEAAAAGGADDDEDEEEEVRREVDHHHHHNAHRNHHHHHPARRRSSVLSMDGDVDHHHRDTTSEEEAEHHHPLLRDDADVRRIWRKATNLITAAYHGTVDEKELARRGHKFRLVHACAGLSDCPADFVKLAVSIHPEQLYERDEKGNLPLHVSAAAKVVVAGDETEMAGAAAAVSTSGEEDRTDDEFHPMEFLVNANPSAAAVRNFNQKLPLHLSVALNVAAGVGVVDSGPSTDLRRKRRRKRWYEGVGAVHRAFRAAIVEGVERTGLYPFMKAAVGAGEGSPDDDEPHLDTIYELLRACPELERFNRWPTPRTRSAAAARRVHGGGANVADLTMTGSSSGDAADGIGARATADGGRGIGTASSSAEGEETEGEKLMVKMGMATDPPSGDFGGGRKRRRSSTSEVEG